MNEDKLSENIRKNSNDSDLNNKFENSSMISIEGILISHKRCN